MSPNLYQNLLPSKGDNAMRKIILTLLLTCFFTASCIAEKPGVIEDTGKGLDVKEAAVKKVVEPGVKNIILVVADGLGVSNIGNLLYYDKLYPQPKYLTGAGGGMERLALQRILSGGNVALTTTNPAPLLSDPVMVTDDAAAATAISCGKKTMNGLVGLLPDGNACPSILSQMKAEGKATGIVTTRSVTDLPVAAFYGHVPSFKFQNALAQQLLESGDVDLIMGGGWSRFIPKGTTLDTSTCLPIASANDGSSHRVDGIDLIGMAAQKDYATLCRIDAFESVFLKTPKKLLALFSSDGFGRIHERLKNSSLPRLAEMTRASIELLSRHPNGFFLVVGCGDISGAAAMNDAGTLFKETLDCDETLAKVLEFADRDPQTLVVFTGGHDVAGGSFMAQTVGADEKLLPHLSNDIEALIARSENVKPVYQNSTDNVPVSAFDLLLLQQKSLESVLEGSGIYEKYRIDLSSMPDCTGSFDLELKNYPYDPRPLSDQLGVDIYGVSTAIRFSEDEARDVATRRLSCRGEDGAKSLSEPSVVPYLDKYRASFYDHSAPQLLHANKIGEVLSSRQRYVWAGGNATPTPTVTAAYGHKKGAALFKGLIDNTDISRLINAAVRDVQK